MISLAILNLCNSSSDESSSVDAFLDKGLELKTCLRRMIIVDEKDITALPVGTSVKVYRGYDALDYAIKVMSGLESPVLGETEIFGQFKKQVLPQLNEARNKKFNKPIQFIISMVKQIRSKHFVGQGAQTYGGLVRKILKSEDNVLFIGAGSFAESIYPWVKPHKNIFFSVRTPEKYGEHDVFKDDVFFDINKSLPNQQPISLIVCAPISAELIANHLKDTNVTTIIDLRDSSDSDPLVIKSAQIYTLGEVFKKISDNLDRKIEIKRNVELDIKDRLNKKLEKSRPISWDETCISNLVQDKVI